MENKNTTEKKVRKASFVTSDQIVEMVYDAKLKETKFAIFNGNEVQYLDTANTGKEIIHPFHPNNDMVSKGIILFPSLAEEYISDEALLSEIQHFIHKYVDISPTFERIATYYVLLTWIYDRYNELPYLRAIGDFGSGKSRFLQSIGSLCYRPIFTGGATTTAPIFRMLDEVHGTLLLDEADMRYSDTTVDLIKILNMGYQKNGNVVRMKGKDNNFDFAVFDVFSPKIIATRETFSDKALESRFLIEEMGRGKLRSDIPRRLDDKFHEDALSIRNKLLMWRFRNYRKERTEDEEPMAGVHPRIHQIIIPLLSIIENEDMKKSLREFAINANKELEAERGLSWESDIVLAILRLAKSKNTDLLLVKEITEEVNRELGFSQDALQAKKVGWCLRARLQLKTYRSRNGYALSLSKNNEKLNMWKERFGITDADIDGEDVNIVNVVNVILPTQAKLLTSKDVGFSS